MKKTIRSMCIILLAIPLLLAVWGFALPAQYGETFVGELPAKRALLAAESGKPRLIIVGGSAAAFGVDSALLARELPDYQPVNFGLYAALGTRVMLDLSINELRPGDLVIVMPEQQSGALADELGAATLWQAVDGDFSALACLHARDLGPMLGTFPRFAGSKLKYFLTGAPEPAGVYRRDAFNAAGDVVSPLCTANIMPGGYDATMPISFDTALLRETFCNDLNNYAAHAAAVGATVYYHFPPMNAAALSDTDAAAIDAYADCLQAQLTAPLAGDPHACVLDAGWFYDTNFHLNASGKTVFTRQLIRDIKAMLGDTTPTDIALPAEPALQGETAFTGGDDCDATYFTVTPDGTAAVNAAGRTRKKLVVPCTVDGVVVTKIDAVAFADCPDLEEVTIQANITALPDGLFAACPALRTVVLTQADPAKLAVGQDLLAGAPESCRIQVPQGSYTAYCLSYAWSGYSDKLQ